MRFVSLLLALMYGRAASDISPMFANFRGSQIEIESHSVHDGRRRLGDTQPAPQCEFSKPRTDIEIPDCAADNCYNYKTIGYAQLACALLIYNEDPSACVGVTVVQTESGRAYQARKGTIRASAKMSTRNWAVTACPGLTIPQYIIPTESKEQSDSPSVDRSSHDLPLIAICSSTTTAHKHYTTKDFSSLALFQILLPSIAKTIEPGFRYTVYIAYDKNNAFYDNAVNQKAVNDWFQEHVSNYGDNAAITTAFKLIVNYGRHKPAEGFRAATKAAYDDGADYFFRLNDDSEIKTPFASQFVAALASLCPPNVGAVGPTCHEGNTGILTHDFTHRTHMDIFNGIYYPVEFVDWWLDDWVTHVYGDRNTFRLADVVVKHHTNFAGTRYKVDQSRSKMLKPLERSGYNRILSYVKNMKVTSCKPNFGSTSSKLAVYSHSMLQKTMTTTQCSKNMKLYHGVALTNTIKLGHVAAVTTTSKFGCCSECMAKQHSSCVAFYFSAKTRLCALFDKNVNYITHSNIYTDVDGVVGLMHPRDVEDKFAAAVFRPLIRGKRIHDDTIKVNFAPSNLATLLPKGWVPADGTGIASHPVGEKTIEFGWSCPVPMSARARDVKADTVIEALHSHIILSTLVILDRHEHCREGTRWEFALDPGAYLVVVGYSDPTEEPFTKGCRLNGMVAEGLAKLDSNLELETNNREFVAVVQIRQGEGLKFSGKFNAAASHRCSSISYILVRPLGTSLSPLPVLGWFKKE